MHGMRFSRLAVCIIVLLLYAQPTHAQKQAIRKALKEIIAGKSLNLGLGVYDFTTGQSFFFNGNQQFPMQSIYKLPLVLALLECVDQGTCSLSDTLMIQPQTLFPDTWSPLREDFPNGTSLPLSRLIQYVIVQSDNNASDILLERIGGPDSVQNYLHKKRIKGIRIKNSEREIQSSWSIQFDNWTTPKGMTELLKHFGKKELLHPESQNFLWETMSHISTGSIKKYLPSEVAVARKTGYSGRNEKGIIAAINDVGIMQVTRDRQIAYVILITDSYETADTNYDLIARIGAALFRIFQNGEL